MVKASSYILRKELGGLLSPFDSSKVESYTNRFYQKTYRGVYESQLMSTGTGRRRRRKKRKKKKERKKKALIATDGRH